MYDKTPTLGNFIRASFVPSSIVAQGSFDEEPDGEPKVPMFGLLVQIHANRGASARSDIQVPKMPATEVERQARFWGMFYITCHVLRERLTLDREMLLALRRVSQDFYRWLEPYRVTLFRPNYLAFTYPPRPPSCFLSLDGLKNCVKRFFEANRAITANATHLHLKIRPTKIRLDEPEPWLSDLFDLPLLQILTITLLADGEAANDHVENTGEHRIPELWLWPEENPALNLPLIRNVHSNALIRCREALERNASKLPKLRTLRFPNLSIAGAQALRYGPLTACRTAGVDESDKFKGRFWSKITTLDVTFVQWWEGDLRGYAVTRQSSDLGAKDSKEIPRRGASSRGDTNPQSPRKHHKVRMEYDEEQQQGILSLYSFLEGFGKDAVVITCGWARPHRVPHNMDPARTKYNDLIEWLPSIGMNPFMRSPAERKRWFSRPDIEWIRLEKLRVAGINIDQEQAVKLWLRMPVLKMFYGPSKGRSETTIVNGSNSDDFGWVGFYKPPFEGEERENERQKLLEIEKQDAKDNAKKGKGSNLQVNDH